ncbi:MAG: hypothetical protein WA252_20990 [Candidatus Sulfotelmatobacter sp.]
MKRSQIQRLQEEIDKLALLVNEAKKQSDRIQAAADAFGERMLVEDEDGARSPSRLDGKYDGVRSTTGKSRTRGARSLRVPPETPGFPGAVT